MTVHCAVNPLIILYTSFVAIAGAARAEDGSGGNADDAVIRIDDRIVDQVYSYGNRTHAEFDVGSAVTVISSADIDARQYSFAADALKEAPGVAVARNGAFGGFASVRIRGGSSGQTLVVIDGIVVNDPSAPQGGFNFANLDIADIDQIEVLRGPQSLVWGADAIGGVISIRTKDQGPPANAYVEAGSRGTVRGGASFFRGGDMAFMRATVSGVRTDGVSRAAGGAEKDGYRSIAASLTGGADIAANADLRIYARISDSHSDIDGFPPPLFVLADTNETEDTTDYALAARLHHLSGDVYEGALSLAYSGVDRANFDLGAQTFAATGDRYSATYWGALMLGQKLTLEGGAEIERTSADVSGIDESATAGAVFATIEAKPAKPFVISAGVRRDEFSDFNGATTSRITGVWKIIDEDEPGGRSNGTALLRASWGQGFRAPTLFELNFDQFGVIPNPNLRPERANAFDIGAEYKLGGARLKTAYFQQRVKDQIDFDFAGNGYFNIDRVKSRGVETELWFAPTSFLDARLAYTLVDAKDANTGARILRTPKHSGAATVSVRPTDDLSFSATLAFNGREADFPAPNRAFAKVDVRASYAVSEKLEVFGRVENVADARYQDVSGFGEPGASAFVGVRMKT